MGFRTFPTLTIAGIRLAVGHEGMCGVQRQHAKLAARVDTGLDEDVPQLRLAVRALIKRCAPISRFDKPSPASRAICVSRVVRSSRFPRALAQPRADGDQLALSTLSKRGQPHLVEHLVREVQFAARVDAVVRPPQPLPLPQVSSRNGGANLSSDMRTRAPSTEGALRPVGTAEAHAMAADLCSRFGAVKPRLLVPDLVVRHWCGTPMSLVKGVAFGAGRVTGVRFWS